MKLPYRLIAKNLIILCTFTYLSGCSLFRLHHESKEIDQISELNGFVETPTFNGKPIVIVLLSVDPTGVNQWNAVIGRIVINRPGPFRFFAPPGTYNVGAFEDLNENESFQANEPVGWHGAPDIIKVAEGIKQEGIRIVLRSPEEAQRELPQLYEKPREKVPDLKQGLRLGEVVSLEDPTFSQVNGKMGLWEPLRFLREKRCGIFFLEPYDPEKVIILFIHGAGGNPAEWRSIINALDRTQFQPWVLFYPSGFRLDIIRQGVANGLNRLQARYKFDRLYLVAHSMGGLVAGGIINSYIENKNGELIRLFVTLSTPWGGHEMAAAGVANSPAVIPSWYDMVPGSPYQEALFKHDLPEHADYYLLFSHRGQFNVMSGGNSDGAVSLKSQLIYPAQERALHIHGYDEDHVSILSSSQVIEDLNRIFADRLNRDRKSFGKMRY